MMYAYKLRHWRTGLYYKPKGQSSKTCLSPTGKIYCAREPPFPSGRQFVTKKQCGHLSGFMDDRGWFDGYIIMSKEDWVLVTYELKEVV